LSERIEIFLQACVAWVDLEGAFVLSDCLTHSLQVLKGVCSANSNPQVHLLQTLGIRAFNAESVAVVANQSDSFVTLGYYTVQTILLQKASNLVDIDRNIVESRSLSCDFKTLLIKVKSLLNLILLEHLIGLFTVLVENDFIQFGLDFLQVCLCLRVRWLEKHALVKVHFGFLDLAEVLKALCSSQEDLHLEDIVGLERLRFVLEVFDQLEGLGRVLDALLVLRLLHVNQTHVGESVFVLLVHFERFLVLLHSLIKVLAVELPVSLFLDSDRSLSLLNHSKVLLERSDIAVTKNSRISLILNDCLNVLDCFVKLREPSLGCASLDEGTCHYLVIEFLIGLELLFLHAVDLLDDIVAVFNAEGESTYHDVTGGPIETPAQEVAVTLEGLGVGVDGSVVVVAFEEVVAFVFEPYWVLVVHLDVRVVLLLVQLL
jgi:hypothetical protein